MPEYDTPQGAMNVDTMWNVNPEDQPHVQMDHPLRAVCTAWLEKIRLASEFKKKKFQEDADEAINS